MDIDRLTLPEVALMSKTIETLGIGGTVEEIQSRVNMLDCLVSFYRKHLAEVTEWNKRSE